MRISTDQIFQQGVSTMLAQQAAVAKTKQQLSTGEKILVPSDDPSAAVRILELNQMIETTNQYQRNTDFAETRLLLEESVLIGVGDLLQRVRELAVRANNDTMSPGDRLAIATEVRVSLEGLLQLANSQDPNGEYLFSGYKTATEPFSHDGSGNFSYSGDQGQRALQIGPSRSVPVGDSGDNVFMKADDGAGGISSMFAAVYDFITDLQADNPSGTTMTRLDSALDQVLTVRADIGARVNTIEAQRNMNESFNLVLEQNRSSLADLDYVKAIGLFEKQTLALEASQQTFVKVKELSLFNFL